VVFLFHPSEVDVQEQLGHTQGHVDAPPDAPIWDMKRVRTPDVRSTPGHVQTACDACHHSANDDVPRIQSGLLSPPSSAPWVLMGYTARLQTPPDASGLCASPGWVAVEPGVGRQEVGVLSMCPRIAWSPGCIRCVMPMLTTAKSFLLSIP
jgi:hypothetical protein